ncbi:MAG: lipoate--protein ligase family protein [Nitrospira sp.]
MRPVRLLDLTLPSAAENLALDEALLNEMDEHGGDPVLRFWESDRYFVVLGRACRLRDDVYTEACRRDNIAVLRRASGGGTVLQGPGCLSYALVLPVEWHSDLRDIRRTNRFILERIAQTLRRWEPALAVREISDLAVNGFKISGNAQRRTRRALLFHGTILHDLPITLVSRYLQEPRKQPAYRTGRPHGQFLRMIDAPLQDIKQAIAATWNVRSTVADLPMTHLQNAIASVFHRSAEEPEEADIDHPIHPIVKEGVP